MFVCCCLEVEVEDAGGVKILHTPADLYRAAQLSEGSRQFYLLGELPAVILGQLELLTRHPGTRSRSQQDIAQNILYLLCFGCHIDKLSVRNLLTDFPDNLLVLIENENRIRRDWTSCQVCSRPQPIQQ